MSPTEEIKTNSESTAEQVERVRKVFVRDLSLQQKVHTVFRVAKKSRHVARSGKAFLALSLVDKTGEIPGRIFDNVETAEAAFEENDYLLLKGTVIHFRGKLQLVVEQLERLAPEPMNAEEFKPPQPPAPPAAAEKPAAKNKPPKPPKPGKVHAAPSSSLAQALEMLGSALEALIQEKIAQHLANVPSSAAASSPSADKTHLPQRAEPPSQKAELQTEPKAESKSETSPARGLPKEFAFKPFDVLTAEENASPSSSEMPPPEAERPPEVEEDKPSN